MNLTVIKEIALWLICAIFSYKPGEYLKINTSYCGVSAVLVDS